MILDSKVASFAGKDELMRHIACSRCRDAIGCDQVKYDCPRANFRKLTLDTDSEMEAAETGGDSNHSDRQAHDWLLTDDDSYQHVRKLDDQTFELIEMSLINPEMKLFEVYADTVHLPDFSEAEMLSIISGFGYSSVAEIMAAYGDEANQVVAECVFEHYGSFAVEPVYRGQYDEARRFVDSYITKTRGETHD